MSEKLLPCPFCGEEAFVHILVNEIAKGYYIACDECGAKTIVFGYEAEAIEAWNRRVKRTAKVEVHSHPCGVSGKCCACGGDVYNSDPYCSHCGVKLDWGDDE